MEIIVKKVIKRTRVGQRCSQDEDERCQYNKLNLSVIRSYTADIKAEPLIVDYDDDPENYPHMYSPPFNPFKQSKWCPKGDIIHNFSHF